MLVRFVMEQEQRRRNLRKKPREVAVIPTSDIIANLCQQTDCLQFVRYQTMPVSDSIVGVDAGLWHCRPFAVHVALALHWVLQHFN